MPDLLFEVGTEEIPAAYLPPAIEQLKREAAERLRARGLGFKSVLATGTPRRLTLFVEELPVAQAGRTEEVPGPPEMAAFKDGQPTAAARGFAEKNGVRVEDLVIKDTPKGRYVFAVRKVEGKHTAELLAEMLPALVRALSFPKSMRWPQAPGMTFARPVRRVLALLGREVLPIEIGGVKAGRATIGHPFLTGARDLAVERADYAAYRALLKSHQVVVDRNERRSSIERAIEEVCKANQAPFTRQELLEEVTDLVEQPAVMVGTFDERYLKLPREVIEAAMTDHQRYFPLVSKDGKVLARFAFVANRPRLGPAQGEGAKADEERAALIREGNERVLRARLEDASFYLVEDLKRPLAERVDGLSGVVFQEKLGTMLQKTARLEAIAAGVASALASDPAAARRAAHLAKADLTTEMVKEFPELQGAIGAEYATRQGEPPEVAAAIREQYLPRFAGDELPKTPAGLALSLAEKLDNLAGFFSIGLAPSGSADPYGLRRQAAGAARILLERGLDVSLGALAALAAAPFATEENPAEKTVAAVLEFIRDRVRQGFLDQGYRYDLIDAAIGAGAENLVDLKRRLDALIALAKEPSFSDLVELVERTFNISRSLASEPAALREDLLTEPEEKALFEAWTRASGPVGDAISRREYAAAAKLYLEALGKPVHTFFEKVYVNVEDGAVRANRLSLLREINRIFAGRVADLAKVVEGKK